jgi:hypothetical protein
VPFCVAVGSCTEIPPGARFLDKPWLAIDTTGGAFAGAVYLVWVRLHLDTGRREVLVSVSKDQGRTYAAPVLLDTLSDAERAGLEELAQVAVRPDGTVDVVWNGVRQGRPLILHAWSTDGGASFSSPETVVRLRPDASRLGIVTSLGTSPHGRLAVCWQQARSADRNDPRVACKLTAKRAGGGRSRNFCRETVTASTCRRRPSRGSGCGSPRTCRARPRPGWWPSAVRATTSALPSP